MTLDTKRPYDEEHLCAGLMANSAKAYSNADAYCFNVEDGLDACAGLNVYECNRDQALYQSNYKCFRFYTSHNSM